MVFVTGLGDMFYESWIVDNAADLPSSWHHCCPMEEQGVIQFVVFVTEEIEVLS